MRRRLTVLAALALAGAGSCSMHRPIRFASVLDRDARIHYELDLDAFQISNGLTVVLAPQPGTNLVTVDTRYEVGAADEPAGKTGLAHFVEHLTFLGRSAPGQPTLEDRLLAAALDHNAFTTWDGTHYVESALASRWPELIDVAATRMGLSCDTIDPALFERERAVVAQELAQRHADAVDPVLAAIFGDQHPYGRSPGGRDLATLDRHDVCAFLDAHYAPDRAILVVSGAFDRKKVRAAIVGRFGLLSRKGVAPVDIAPLDQLPGPSHARVTADLAHRALVFAYPAPRFGSDEAIYQLIVDDLASDVVAAVDRDRKDVTDGAVYRIGGDRGGSTILVLTLTDDAKVDEVSAALQAKLERGLDVRPGYYLPIMKGYIYARLLGRYDDLSTRGAMIADYMQYNHSPALHLHDLEVARGMSSQGVTGYAARALARAPHKIIELVPRGDRPGAGSIRRLAPTETLDLPASATGVDVAEADTALVAPPTEGHAYDEVRLDNGLRVIFAYHPSSSLFEARMVFPTGTIDDPRERPGTARLAATRLDLDYDSFGGSTYRKLVVAAQTGTLRSASVGDSTTVFATSGVASYAAWHLWWLHVRLEGGDYDNQGVSAAQRSKDEVRARALRATVMGKLFGADHPYAHVRDRGPIGWAQLDKFRDAHYVADGATLIISGNFDRAEIETEIRELFGAWPHATRPAPAHVPAASPAIGPTVLAEDDADRDQTQLRIAFLARSATGRDTAARRVAIEMIDLRLAAIREELAASYGVYAHYDDSDAGDLIEIEGAIDAARASEVLARVTAELTALRDHADTLRADFVRARRAAFRRALARAGSIDSTADEAEAIAERGLPLDYYERLPAAVGAVTPADVAAILKGDLDPARMVELVSGPDARAAATAAHLGPVTAFP